MKLSAGKRKLLEKIIEARELPEEVLQALELISSGELELDPAQYPELVKALLKAPDEEDTTYNIGGIIKR